MDAAESESSKLPPQSSRPATAHKRKGTTTTKHGSVNTPVKDGGVTKSVVAKPKQSKSRNGCITCKAKRLKCDETKPSCQQCRKRNVTCGGYKKDFKWRPFEEATFSNKVVPPARPKSSGIPALHCVGSQAHEVADLSPPTIPETQSLRSPTNSDISSETHLGTNGDQTHGMFFNAAMPSPSALQMQDMNFSTPPFPSTPFVLSPQYTESHLQRPMFEPNSVTSSLDSLFEDSDVLQPTTSRPTFSGQSPKLIDLLLPGSPLNAPPVIPNPLPAPLIDAQASYELDAMHDSILDEDVEEIIRQPVTNDSMWVSTNSPMQVSLGLRGMTQSPTMPFENPFNRMYRQPEFQAGSPEMLMLRFDKQTCGILSVKDGPTENPWRTLIWPLARDSPSLYHAIASMTAFHTSKEKPALRVDGMEHMRRSIRSLATGIEKMRTDTALATTLVLAFSESWDQHISTGIEHLRGAKILVNQALMKHNRKALRGDDLARLKFLCNAWVYMDVIARLTSVDDDDSEDFENIVSPLNGPFGFDTFELDPLMGCASTLFPLIGRVANLCRKVRNTESNSIAFISQAMDLKQQIEQWQSTGTFETPEDPSAEVQHAMQTAEAYRYATLLYLHQAVPEIPSLSSAQLAKKVLVFLATVPLSSRLVIVHIYPLLAAGCEAYEPEDRKWVEDRWTAMSQRMWIGNIDKCLIVTQEVWRRRDAMAAKKEAAKMNQQAMHAMMYSESSKRKLEEEMEDVMSYSDMLNGNGTSNSKRHQTNNLLSFQSNPGPPHRRRPSDSITEALDPGLTVRGSLHWVGVMKDWEWEILLG